MHSTEQGSARQTDVFVPVMMHPLVSMRPASLSRVFVCLPEGSAPGLVHGHLDAFLDALDQQDPNQFPYRRIKALLNLGLSGSFRFALHPILRTPVMKRPARLE